MSCFTKHMTDRLCSWWRQKLSIVVCLGAQHCAWRTGGAWQICEWMTIVWNNIVESSYCPTYPTVFDPRNILEVVSISKGKWTWRKLSGLKVRSRRDTTASLVIILGGVNITDQTVVYADMLESAHKSQ